MKVIAVHRIVEPCGTFPPGAEVVGCTPQRARELGDSVEILEDEARSVEAPPKDRAVRAPKKRKAAPPMGDS